VPVATYTGWTLRADGLDGCDAAAQKIAFARTKAERLAAGDPRPSLEERYVDHGAYVSAVTRAAQALKAERFLLDGLTTVRAQTPEGVSPRSDQRPPAVQPNTNRGTTGSAPRQQRELNGPDGDTDRAPPSKLHPGELPTPQNPKAQ
jgi:hypothetical protein